MDFLEPEVTEEEFSKEELAKKDAKTEETVNKLEKEIDNAYTAVEHKFQDLWTAASKNASNLQETYKLEEHKKQLLDQLSSARENINNKTKVNETLTNIEEQMKKLSIPNVDLKNLSDQANSVLDSLDSKLEQVEKQAGKYVSQFTSFFSNIVSVSPAETAPTVEEKETLFSTSLNDHENYGTTRYDNELFKLHTTASYYLSADLDENDEFSKFDADDYTDEISNLLKTYENTLTKLMNSLVPVEIPYETFWYRYFKHVNLLKESDQKRKALLEKKEKSEGNEEDEEEFTWDDEDEE